MLNFSKNLVELLGKDIWLVGGGGIVAPLLKAGLIGEIILSIIPVVIGNSIPLFQNVGKDIKFDILETIEYEGLTQMRLRVQNHI